jgi:hypothetical protein
MQHVVLLLRTLRQCWRQLHAGNCTQTVLKGAVPPSTECVHTEALWILRSSMSIRVLQQSLHWGMHAMDVKI